MKIVPTRFADALDVGMRYGRKSRMIKVYGLSSWKTAKDVNRASLWEEDQEFLLHRLRLRCLLDSQVRIPDTGAQRWGTEQRI